MQSRYAIFVDAGYLLSEAGKGVLGSGKRAIMDVDYPALIQKIKATLSAHAGPNSTLLRMYWYDGAHDGVLNESQQRIASLPHVKVRVGRLSSNRQKGVDSLLVRDLITLAFRKAIDVAYVISGDEDIREGVSAAQEEGVRVVLVGVESREGSNQALTLLRESDEVLQLELKVLHPFFRALSSGTSSRAITHKPSQVVITHAQQQRSRGVAAHAAQAIGASFAYTWLQAAQAQEIEHVLLSRPKIPTPVDAQLLSLAERILQPNLVQHPDVRAALRLGFWDVIDAHERAATGRDDS